MRKPWSLTGLTAAWIRCASWTRNRCTVSRSSSREYRGTALRAVSRSVGTSTMITVSCASSSLRLPPSRAAVRSADRIALPVGRRANTGIRAADSFWATGCRQVNATEVSPWRQSRSWKDARAVGPADSSRTCTPREGMPSSPNASSTSARLSMSMLDLARSPSPVRLARSSAANRALPLSGM